MAARPKYCYNDRVEARTALALELNKEQYAERRNEAGVLPRDLEAISRHGREAARQDGLQKAALAGQYTDLEAQSEARAEFDTTSDKLRNCLPIVTLELKEQPEHRNLGNWLDKVSFKRFRVRLPAPETEAVTATAATEETGETPAPAAATGETPAAERVERRDRLAIARAVLQLTEAVLADGREPIVEALAERGLPRERLEWLRDQATEQVNTLGGILRLRAVEATKLESDAAENQKKYWDCCRRAIRPAVIGDLKLEELWAKC